MWILSNKDAILISRSSSHLPFSWLLWIWMGKDIISLGSPKPPIIGNDSEQGKEIQIWILKDCFGSSVENESEGQDEGQDRCLDSCKGSESGKEGGAGPYCWMTGIWWPDDLKNDNGQEAAKQPARFLAGHLMATHCFLPSPIHSLPPGSPCQLPRSPGALYRALSAICAPLTLLFCVYNSIAWMWRPLAGSPLVGVSRSSPARLSGFELCLCHLLLMNLSVAFFIHW